MPAQPSWALNLFNAITALRASDRRFVARAEVEFLLGVGRRRAQQILAPCVTDRVGSNGIADREVFIRHLEGLARSEAAGYEARRREKVAQTLGKLRADRLANPAVMVEAPVKVLNHEIADLPPGVKLGAGKITVLFDTAEQALQSLVALGMAIGNDFEGFERATLRSS